MRWHATILYPRTAVSSLYSYQHTSVTQNVTNKLKINEIHSGDSHDQQYKGDYKNLYPSGWLVGWGLTALLTQNRSYRACRFVGIFYSKLQYMYLYAYIYIYIYIQLCEYRLGMLYKRTKKYQKTEKQD